MEPKERGRRWSTCCHGNGHAKEYRFLWAFGGLGSNKMSLRMRQNLEKGERRVAGVLAGASGLQKHLGCFRLALSAVRSLNRFLSSPPGQRKGRFLKKCKFAAHICRKQRHRSSATLHSSSSETGNTQRSRTAETANNSRPRSVLLSLRTKRSSRTSSTSFCELLYSLFCPFHSL